MLVLEQATFNTPFTNEAISQQLQKIILDPVFKYSEILKNFLTYVVTETLQGHANRLKEYTIAVNVLEKPTDFNPQEYGIVRIHAGRLRVALDRYYSERGARDNIRISIPKGSYVPVFDENNYSFSDHIALPRKAFVLGIAPFKYVHHKGLGNSFADGLGIQLSDSLMKQKYFSVVAHYTMCHLFSENAGMEMIRSTTGAQLVMTGDIQVIKGNLRVHIQLISTASSRLFWSHMYECNYAAGKLFAVQDEIVRQILHDFSAIDF